MPLIFYRGDSRTPDEVVAFNGFHGWIDLSIDQARLVATMVSGGAANTSSLPEALTKAWKGIVIKNTLDLMQNIKYTKNKSTTPQISTSADEQCGGQANGKDAKGKDYRIYKFEHDALYVFAGGTATLATTADLTPAGFRPKLLLDATTIAAANVVALAGKDEIAFLTPITADKIKVKSGSTYTAIST